MRRLRVVISTVVIAGFGATIGLAASVLQDQVRLSALDYNKNIFLVSGGVETAVGTVDAGGRATVALDLNKNYTVYKRGCQRYVIVVTDGPDDCQRDRREQAQAAAGDCDDCLPVGYVTGGRYIPAPRGTLPSGGGFTFYALGSGNFTNWMGADGACTTTAARYALVNYTNSVCTTDASTPGATIGGGFEWDWNETFGMSFEVSYSTAGGLNFDTSGDRTNGNLLFAQTSSLVSSSLRFDAGVPIQAGSHIRVVPHVTATRRRFQQEVVDSLFAGTPQQQVAGGTLTTEASSVMWGAGVRVESREYGPLRFFGDICAGLLRAPESTTFGPAAKTPWPTDMKTFELSGGVKVRLVRITRR